MIQGLNHIGLSVTDLDRAITFYRDVLGLELAVQTTFAGEKYATVLGLNDSRGKVAVLRRGTVEVELFEFENPRPPACRLEPARVRSRH